MFKVTRTAFYAAALFALAPSMLLAQSSPVLKASYLYGGSGDQYGYGIAKDGPDVYISGSESGSTLLLKLKASDGSIVWTATPVETLFQHDVAVDSSNAYTAGGAFPPACGAIDGFGGTEAKPLFGIHGVATGVKTSCGSVNYYPSYRGHETYYSIAAGGGIYYAAGWAEQFGFGGHKYIVAKYDSAGVLLDSAADPSTYSFGYGVAVDAADVYVSGFRRNSSWHGDPELPFLVKLDSNLNEVWRQTIDAGAVGARAQFFDLAVDGGFVYSVGHWLAGGNQDFLVAKFSTSGGPPIWQQVWGTAGSDGLRDVVVAEGRLFAVGTSGGDAVLVELDPATGGALPSPAPFGGSGDENALRIVADGSDLFIVGYANSFATTAGNSAGSYDALLLRYSLVRGVSIDIKPGSFPNSINLGSNGTVPVAILSSATFNATTVDPTTVTLAGASVALRGKGTASASIQDVNGDGLPDLVVHVSTQALHLTDGDTEALLEGETYSGQPIEGSDSVRIVP